MREEGFFNAWKKLAKRNVRFTLLGLKIKNILEADGSAEGTIIYALRQLGIKQEHWTGYFTRELAHLHGWSGFIRWREQAEDYHSNKQFPGDLVDEHHLQLIQGSGSFRRHAGGGRHPETLPIDGLDSAALHYVPGLRRNDGH